MILEPEFCDSVSETHVEELTRLRTGYSRLHTFHRNAVTGLDYMRSLDPHLVSPEVVRTLVIPILEGPDGQLALGGPLVLECPALARSVEALTEQLRAAHDRCLSRLCVDDGTDSLEEFRKLDGALLSPVSILDYLLSEEKARLLDVTSARAPTCTVRATMTDESARTDLRTNYRLPRFRPCGSAVLAFSRLPQYSDSRSPIP
jgi:hypothetical protein